MNTYLIFKLIHIIAVIIFLGNIFTGLFWMHRAHKSRDPLIINHTMKTIIIADRFFTIPGVIVIIAAGVTGAIKNHMPLLSTGWIFWAIVLFTISGIAFSWKVAPLQKKIYQYTLEKNRNEQEFNWGMYEKLFKNWDFWGLISLLTPIIALIMMVLKWPGGSIFPG